MGTCPIEWQLILIDWCSTYSRRGGGIADAKGWRPFIDMVTNRPWRLVFVVSAIVCLSTLGCAQEKGAAAGPKPGSALAKQRSATATPSQEPGSITVACQSAVDLVIVDPQGRRLGDDPIAHAQYNEIPNAYYEAGGIDDDETGMPEEYPAKTIFIPAPEPGQYTIQVTGAADGAYSASFTLQRPHGSNSEAELRNLPINLNQTQMFVLIYNPSAEPSLQVRGGPNKDEPNSELVNKFLVYITPKDNHVLLPKGTAKFRVRISYSARIMPGTFSATFGGENISAFFHPQPCTSEEVTIPVKPGRNFLDTAVSGNVGGRTATDTNRLVFDDQRDNSPK
jgi:hypothetical protein